MKSLYKISFICFFGAVLFSSSVNAQFLGGTRIKENESGPKGQILIYGSYDYSKTSTPSGKSSSIGTSPSANASIPIGVGYFINNNDLIGVNYASAKDVVNGSTVYKQNEAGIWYSPSVMLGQYFGLIAQVDAHYVWGKQLDTSGPMENFNGFRLRAYPMLAVFMGSGWALKFKFAELSMLQTKTDEGWTKTTVAGMSGSTFGVGISKAIDFRKKSKL
jgi:hypothetical protein